MTIFVNFLKFEICYSENILDWFKSLKVISSEILLRFKCRSPIFCVFVHACFRLSRAFSSSFSWFSFVCFLYHRDVFSLEFGVYVIFVLCCHVFVMCVCVYGIGFCVYVGGLFFVLCCHCFVVTVW